MIRKTLLWLSGGILAVVIVLFIIISFRWNRRFAAPYPRIVASTDTAVIARGRYLAYGPAHCSDCHTAPAEYASLKSGDARPPLSGGGTFPIPLGTIEVPNITPDKETGIGMLSDSAVARMLRYGVRPDGRSAIPFMEYHEMSDADIAALISFLRAQPPVHNPVPDQWIRILGKRIAKLHIKEFSREKSRSEGLGKGFDVEFLKGSNDWPAIMAALDEIGYNGWGIAEPGGGSSPEGLKKLSTEMDRIFAS